MEQAGCRHEEIVTFGGAQSVTLETFTWVNTIIGNVKNAIHSSYHTISDRHLPRYLAEFCYRFNRRYKRADMIPRLGYRAVRTPPMPKRLLSMAEVWGQSGTNIAVLIKGWQACVECVLLMMTAQNEN